MGYKRGNESDQAAIVANNLTDPWIIARSQPEQFSWQSKGWQAKGSPQNPGNVKDARQYNYSAPFSCGGGGKHKK